MIIKPCSISIKSVDLFEAIANEKYPMFLDSNQNFEELGRYSIIVANPFGYLKTIGNQTDLNLPTGHDRIIGNPFKILKEMLIKYKVKNNTKFPFVGGLVGYLAYDLAHFIEKLPTNTIDDIQIPDMFFGLYDGGVIFDHYNEKVFIVDSGVRENENERILWWERKIKQTKQSMNLHLYHDTPPYPDRKKDHSAFKGNMSKQEYFESILKIKEYIKNGDIYQANFTQRFSATFKEDPVQLYLQLREKNPAPFAAYLDIGDSYILSSSPERFIKLVDRVIETRPIKGTISRGLTPAEDAKNKSILENSEKDKAELLMIVDLERNDLGKVAKTGTVEVLDLFKVEEYTTVYHLVSTIRAVLDDGYDVVDLIQATFPGGSITGAPKIRAMEIIDELEPTKRNVYTGSIGYIDFRGNTDLNIAIRTIVIKDGTAHFQVGGGIVWDSDPVKEYDESLAKGKALFEVLKS
ncbi:aminodeoxychorismate synthase component I [Tepidibacillus fermentans]|uniref:aminodeoxychorismate synthase n=1 Tax=Tepidibacillus fermentans TaxID=1281767 RepID=A0A4R3KBC2_9BACI|nr:aminodeoxychorismate synthase component I [Tepidibacillus fermentans]TCS80338.1 aminodeoxychorismate synthase subunit I [Tepidibacillus fermentans]